MRARFRSLTSKRWLPWARLWWARLVVSVVVGVLLYLVADARSDVQQVRDESLRRDNAARVERRRLLDEIAASRAEIAANRSAFTAALAEANREIVRLGGNPIPVPDPAPGPGGRPGAPGAPGRPGEPGEDGSDGSGSGPPSSPPETEPTVPDPSLPELPTIPDACPSIVVACRP